MMILIGLILPPLIALLTRFIKDSDGRFWASVAVCVLFGVGLDLIAHNGTSGYFGMSWNEVADSLSKSAMEMVGIAKVSYEAIWNNSIVGKQIADSNTTLLKTMNLKK